MISVDLFDAKRIVFSALLFVCTASDCEAQSTFIVLEVSSIRLVTFVNGNWGDLCFLEKNVLSPLIH